MRDLIIVAVAMPVLVLFWVATQHITRLYSLRHPELGSHREEGGGCGSRCGCSGSGRCKRQQTRLAQDSQKVDISQKSASNLAKTREI